MSELSKETIVSEMMETNEKNPVGHALKMLTDFSVETKRGTVSGKAGDYIVKRNNGTVSVLKSSMFFRKYRVLR
ncbi:hypothetical protein [Methanohalophilus euhalobius]|uniref:Uncharacterized protein n=1 Tax=Methanohalophilus euhalobius TaxID=51203 RepID=A0A314ZQE2_9EURY|nr:hypothetical protein [Methanohalophilus euhalobius]PQV43355.1 hypothetical protein B0H22_10276 [Methanohalophilus euhalobius]RNI07581.1 hypothetical protein EDD83_08550 [Methanohalophilus euhalobius]